MRTVEKCPSWLVWHRCQGWHRLRTMLKQCWLSRSCPRSNRRPYRRSGARSRISWWQATALGGMWSRKPGPPANRRSKRGNLGRASWQFYTHTHFLIGGYRNGRKSGQVRSGLACCPAGLGLHCIDSSPCSEGWALRCWRKTARCQARTRTA